MTRCVRLWVLLALLAVSSFAPAQPPVRERSTPGTVLITGSSRGLGLELAMQYAAADWQVIATARDPDGAAERRATQTSRSRSSTCSTRRTSVRSPQSSRECRSTF